jgi:hypothetical protein
MDDEQPKYQQPTYKTEKKPQWSLDVKIISGIDDIMQSAANAAIQLELGDGNQYKNLKAYLYEAFLQMGGTNDSVTGNLLDPKMREALTKYFAAIRTIEKDAIEDTEKHGNLSPEDFYMINEILVNIRSILYAERNRNFIKFITIHSREEIIHEQALGRG